MPLGIEPMPFGIIRESQRDSDPKPRVASRELPWEKRVVSANPNGVVARWRSGATTPRGCGAMVELGRNPFSCAIWRHYNLCYYPTNGTTTDSDIWHVL